MNKKRQVSLRTQLHNNACVFILGEEDPQLAQRLKPYPFIKYSQEHHCLYVAHAECSLNRLFNLLRSLDYYVDYSAVDRKMLRQDHQQTAMSSGVNKPHSLFGEYVSYLRGLRLSKSTQSVYSNFVRLFLKAVGYKKPDQWTPTDVRLFVEAQIEGKNYSISTHRQLISGLKHLVTLTEAAQIDAEALPRPKKSRYIPTVLSKEEVIVLIRVTRNLKHRMAIAFLYSSGLRVGELINMEIKDVDLDRMQAFVKRGKNRKDRAVVLAQNFLPLFRNYMMTYRPRRWVMEGAKGGQYTAGSIRVFLKKWCKEAGIRKKVTPHTLRHSFATHLIENGVGVMHVQQLLGHSKPETTMIYTHIARKDLLNIKSPLDSSVEALIENQNNQSNQTDSWNLLR